MLRKIQVVAARLWIIYGVSIGALPVIIANLIVAGAAFYSSFRRPAQGEERSAHSIERNGQSEIEACR